MKTRLSILCLVLAAVMCLSGCVIEFNPSDLGGLVDVPIKGTNANDKTTAKPSETKPEPVETEPEPVETTTNQSILDKVEDALFGSYEDILVEYTKRLQEATPILIEEYNEAAKVNQDGLMGLATLCNEKVRELAVISNEGIQEMASWYYKHGNGSYEEYSEWAGKLQEVYMEEASKIQEAYMNSAK